MIIAGVSIINLDALKGIGMNRTTRRISVGIIVAVFIVTALLLRGQRQVQADSGYRLAMGTFARVVVIAPDSRTAQISIKEALDEILMVDNFMSDYKEDSEISKINREGYKAAVKVSQRTFEVLQEAIRYSELSQGAFDVTVGPLVDLWRSAAEANSIPSETELEQARSKVGYEKLLLDANEMSVRLAVEGMRLDLGGIAKGYAIDLAVEAMQRVGALGAMVDIGGDIRCFGTAPKERKKWRIGLQDPNVPAETVIGGTPTLVLELGDAAVATSGGYRRFTLIEGQKYSHIISTSTARGADGPASVTIIAPKAIDADALATAVTVLGPEKGLALIEGIPDTEAILISAGPEYKITKTAGAEKYMKP